jgi:phage host-nuclease inhibitor protein Gam
MARPRKTSVVLKTLADCDDAMLALKVAMLERESLEAARDKAVAGITEKYAPEVRAQVDLAKELELRLQNFYMEHVDDLEKDGRKSVKLAHGVMGRRLGAAKLSLANKSWTWQAVVARLAEKFGDRFLRTSEPEVKKDEVKRAEDVDAKTLRECGLKLEQGEDFYAEPTRTAATGTAEAA